MTTSLRVAAALLLATSMGLGCARGTDATSDDEAAEGGPDVARLVARLPEVEAPAPEAPPPAEAPAPWGDPPACSDATQFVYVLSDEGEIHRFSPPTLSFERVGRPACLPQGLRVFSMAVDRHARAYLLAHDERVYRVDLASGACERTKVDRGDADLAFRHYGMAFASDATAPGGESLFIRESWVYADEQGMLKGTDSRLRRLATLDPVTARIEIRGTGVGGDADLTGTGDGALYGFFYYLDKSPEVGAIDPRTGALGARWSLPSVEVTGGYALAAWGGDLWLFSSDPGETARARRFRPSLGVVDVASAPAGFHIVGAGVSTCAPTGGDAPRPVEPPA